MALQIILLPLPWALRRLLLNLLPGFRLHPKSRIGWSVFNVARLELHEGAYIGSLNYAKGLRSIVVEEFGIINNLNWITAYPAGGPTFFQHCEGREPALVVRRHAAITSRHLIDCTGGVEVGAFAIVAGWGSQVISHSIDLEASRQDAHPVHVGEYSFVGSRSVLLMGSRFPDRSVLVAGSTFGLRDAEPGGVFGGVPARRLRDVDGAFFSRERGYVT